MSCNDEKHLAGRQELLAFLDKNPITYEETHHPAVTSMQEHARLGLGIEGVRCKNLLMHDKKKQRLLLVVAQADRPRRSGAASGAGGFLCAPPTCCTTAWG